MKIIFVLSIVLYAVSSTHGFFWNTSPKALSVNSIFNPQTLTNILQNLLNTVKVDSTSGQSSGSDTRPATPITTDQLATAVINELIATNQIKPPAHRPPPPKPPTVPTKVTTTEAPEVDGGFDGLLELNNFINQISTTVRPQEITMQMLQAQMMNKPNKTMNATDNQFGNAYNSINEDIGNFFSGFISSINSTVTNATQSLFGNGPQINFPFLGGNGTRTDIKLPELSDTTRLLIMEEVASGKVTKQKRRGSQTRYGMQPSIAMDVEFDSTETKKFLVDAIEFLDSAINSVDIFTRFINKTLERQTNNLKYLEKNLIARMGTFISQECKSMATRGIGDVRVVAKNNGFNCVYDEINNYQKIRRIANALILDIKMALNKEQVDVEMISNIFATFDIVTNEFETTQVRFQDCEKAAGLAITAKTIEVSTKIAACQVYGLVL